MRKKIGSAKLEADAGATAQYAPLLAGIYSVAETIEIKSAKLKIEESINSKDLSDKVQDVVRESKAYTG
ncbi:hypothetical protein [Borrelia hermsii]|uniref:hypothetical protein n=1 Tax=Borrelia hermsii TaxID=140 RepID=UPI0012D31B45|nr:hypothetical protein [Borrelia hermsii]